MSSPASSPSYAPPPQQKIHDEQSEQHQEEGADHFPTNSLMCPPRTSSISIASTERKWRTPTP